MLNVYKQIRSIKFFAFLSIVIFLICLPVLYGYFDNAPRIEGTYNSYPQKNMSKIGVEFSVFREGKRINSYTVKLKKNGYFNFKIKEEGEYFLMATGNSCPSNLWEHFFLSDDMRVYFYNFEKGKTIKLPPQYISEAITIISPRKDEVYDVGDFNNIVFEWEENPFADFYNLNILKVNNDGNELIISAYKIGHKIEYNKITDTTLIDKEKVFDWMMKELMFAPKFKPLETGKYIIEITAYKALNKEKRILVVSKTNTALETNFFVGRK